MVIRPKAAVLLLLRRKPAIISEMCRRTGAQPVQFYPALEQLLRAKLVSSETVKVGARRRAATQYRLTAKGQKFAKQEADTLRAFLR